MVRGRDSCRRSLVKRLAKTARICSKRSATSRPFFSPASVITVKCVEWISSHGDFSAAGAHRHTTTTSVSARRNRIGMKHPRTIARCQRKGRTTFTQCYHEGCEVPVWRGHSGPTKPSQKRAANLCLDLAGKPLGLETTDATLLRRCQQATG